LSSVGRRGVAGILPAGAVPGIPATFPRIFFSRIYSDLVGFSGVKVGFSDSGSDLARPILLRSFGGEGDRVRRAQSCVEVEKTSNIEHRTPNIEWKSVWKIRNPKPEIRKKSEGRNPKAEGVGA